MQRSRGVSQKWPALNRKGNLARKFAAWKVKGLRKCRDLSRVPKEDIFIVSMFAMIIVVTIWLATKLL